MGTCRECGRHVEFEKDKNGKWLCVNADGTQHLCLYQSWRKKIQQEAASARRKRWISEHSDSLRSTARSRKEAEKGFRYALEREDGTDGMDTDE